MALDCKVEQGDGYRLARVGGEPTLDEFLSFQQALGGVSPHWAERRLLVDLRGVRSLRAFTEHYAIGEATARCLGHLRKIASVVPADRITRASEKTTRRAGVDLTVFTSEAEAIAWPGSDLP